MDTRLDFLILEEFLRQHPELTPEERSEVLALDLNHGHQPVIVDRDTKREVKGSGECGHVFEETEIELFLRENQLTYATLYQRTQRGARIFSGDRWQEKLADYVIKHLDPRKLQENLDLNGFPIAPDQKLLTADDPPPEGTTVARYNFDLYLQWLESAVSSSFEIDDLAQVLSVGPMRAEKVEIKKRNSENWEDGETFVRFGLGLVFVPDPLFWRLIDPLDEDHDLKFRFEQGREPGLETLRDKLEATDEQYSFSIANTSSSFVGDVIEPADALIYLSAIVSSLRGTSALLIPPHDTSLTLPESFLLTREGKELLEETVLMNETVLADLLNAPFQDTHQPAAENQKTFLKMFGLDDSHQIFNARVFKVTGQAYQPLIDVNDLLLANGYWVTEIGVLRVLEMSREPTPALHSTARADNIPQYEFRATPVKAEPLSQTEVQRFQDFFSSGTYANNENYPLSPYITDCDYVFLPALIGFSLEHGLWERLITQYPFIAPVFKDLKKEEAIPAIEKFFGDIQRMLARGVAQETRYGSPFYEEGIIDPALLIALKDNPNPRACLAILLINASTRSYSSIGESLPYILSQIDWFVKDTFLSQFTRDDAITASESIIVGGSYDVLGNAWCAWDASALFALGKKLSEVPETELREGLRKIATRDLSYADWTNNAYANLAVEHRPDFPEKHPIDKTIVPDFKYDPCQLDAKKLMRAAKLKSTREKIVNLRDKDGTVPLDKLINIHFSAPEREDIRRALNRVLDEHTTYFLSFDLGQPQPELLPTHVFENWIRHEATQNTGSGSTSKEVVWQTLTSRDEKKALQLFEEYLLQDGTRIAYIFSYGYDHILASPSAQATEFLQTHESLLRQVYYLVDDQQKLTQRLYPYAKLQTLSQSFSENTMFYEYKNCTLLVVETLQARRFRSETVSSNELRDLFGQSLDAEVLELVCFIYANDNNTVPLAAIDKLAVWNNGKKADELYPSTNETLLRETIGVLLERDLMTEDIARRTCGALVANFLSDNLSKIVLDDLVIKLGRWAEDNGVILSRDFRFLAYVLNLSGDWRSNTIAREDVLHDAGNGKQMMDDHLLELLTVLEKSLSSPPAYTFYKLREEYGDYSLPESKPAEKLKGSYALARLTFDETTPIGEESYWPIERLLHGYHLGVFDDVGFINKIVKATHERDLKDIDILHELTRPEEALPVWIRNLYYFSQFEYPRTAIERDSTHIPFDDIQDVKDAISTSYFHLCESLVYLVLYQKLNAQFALTAPDYASFGVTEDMLDRTRTDDPQLSYSLLLVKGLYGDATALSELELFFRGKKVLATRIEGLGSVSPDLLAVGEIILRHKRPELFKKAEGDNRPVTQHTMALAELSHPNPYGDSLRHLWANPQISEVESSLTDHEHPTQVMGIMTDVLSGQPTGTVYSVVLENVNGSLCEEFLKALQKVVEARERGEPIGVVNFSIGATTNLDQPITSPELSIQIGQTLDRLSQFRIPVVIAAGNESQGGHGHIVDLTGQEISALSAIDSRIIVVGSSVQVADNSEVKLSAVQDDWGVSAFSGTGNDRYRPDLVAAGENVWVQDEAGGQAVVSGTSFSAPKISRLIVQMKELNPHLTVEMIQAILKITAEDLKKDSYYNEGAGQVQEAACLYAAYAINPLRTAGQRRKMAESLGLRDQKNLDWLIRRLRLQVWFTDTNRQTYGE